MLRLEVIKRKGLFHVLLQRLVGQPFRQGIPGHQTVGQLRVILSGEDFGLLHDFGGAPRLHQSPENVEAPLPQGLLQERHVVECQLHSAGSVCDIHVEDAQFADSSLVRDAGHGSIDGTDCPGGGFA